MPRDAGNGAQHVSGETVDYELALKQQFQKYRRQRAQPGREAKIEAAELRGDASSLCGHDRGRKRRPLRHVFAGRIVGDAIEGEVGVHGGQASKVRTNGLPRGVERGADTYQSCGGAAMTSRDQPLGNRDAKGLARLDAVDCVHLRSRLHRRCCGTGFRRHALRADAGRTWSRPCWKRRRSGRRISSSISDRATAAWSSSRRSSTARADSASTTMRAWCASRTRMPPRKASRIGPCSMRATCTRPTSIARQ